MHQARYFLPDHPRLKEVYGKNELRAFLQSGEISRSDMVCDDETGLAHFIGDLLATAYPDATVAPTRSTSSSVPAPMPPAQEFRANTPLQEPEPLPADDEDEDEHAYLQDEEDDEPADDEEPEESLTNEEEDAEDFEETGEMVSETSATVESEYLPGEEALLYIGHPSWRAYPRALLMFLLLAGAGAYCFQKHYGLEWTTLFGSVAGLIVLFISLDRTTTTYYVTTRRVEMEFGIVGRNTKEVRICDIRAIDVIQKGYKAWMRLGTVSFDSSASGGVEVWFKDVSKPHEIKQLVRQLQG